MSVRRDENLKSRQRLTRDVGERFREAVNSVGAKKGSSDNTYVRMTAGPITA